jgi:dihydroneopterin aldolase / 2-amino-4-hydroxy-6-hydroxymethyldihydropteridine diphosphokinase
LPHPRAHERGFVLVPWAEVDRAATARVGEQVCRVADLVDEVDTSGVRPGPDWSPEW